MQVDLSPLVEAAVGLAATALTIFGSMALRAAERKWNFQLTEAQTAAWDSALTKAVTYAGTKTEDLIKAKGWDHPDVKNAVLAQAESYLVLRFPQVLAAQGLDYTSPSAKDVIRSALARALPSAFTSLAASPATPASASPTAVLTNG